MDQLGVVLDTINYSVLDETFKCTPMKLNDSQMRTIARENNQNEFRVLIRSPKQETTSGIRVHSLRRIANQLGVKTKKPQFVVRTAPLSKKVHQLQQFQRKLSRCAPTRCWSQTEESLSRLRPCYAATQSQCTRSIAPRHKEDCCSYL